MHVGFAEFFAFGAMMILFAAAWRTIMYAAKRKGYTNLSGAMSFLF
jgi:hypothetical protein